MRSRMFRLLLLGIFTVLFMDEGKAWKGRTCSTEHFYFSDRSTGRYLFRFTRLSCQSCEEGPFQVFHDLLRETYCCSEEDLCNDGRKNIDVSTGNVEW
ncbi:prostate and testis expressed protein 13-like [Trichechus inunguis]